jgi:predicted peptidase
VKPTWRRFTHPPRMDRKYTRARGEHEHASTLLYPPTDMPEPRAPLIIFLHGVSERGSDLTLVKRWGPPRWLDEGHTFPAYLAAPQCQADAHWEDVLEELDTLLAALLDAHPIDVDRVYLTGFSMGSFGVWQWAVSRPGHLGALLPVGGHGYRFEGSDSRATWPSSEM